MVNTLRMLLNLTLDITIKLILQIRYFFYVILLKYSLKYMNNLINKNNLVSSQMEELIQLYYTKMMIIII